MVIAVSGKGGVGKSTVAALVIRYLLLRGNKPVLAVDADPNSTLGDKLGLAVDNTVGDLREAILQSKHEAPAGVPKQRGVEYEVQQAIVEGKGVDLLVMGRGEGPGCYCSINNMLRSFLQNLTTEYKHVVVDNEAGMEHLSRRTNDKVGLMLVVSDPTPTSLKAARRVAELADKHGVVQGRIGLVVNRANRPFTDEEAREATGLELLGCVPHDAQVDEYELSGKALLELPGETPSTSAIRQLLNNLGI